jgi:hypothetical protein
VYDDWVNTIGVNMAGILSVIASIATIIGAIYAIYKRGFKKGYAQAREELRDNFLRHSFEKVYAPLRAELLNIHVTVCSATKFPYFRQRLSEAIFEFKNQRSYKRKFKCFWKALFDKGIIGPDASIEFGTSFPMKKLKSILQENSIYVDSKLMELYRRADRAGYEDYHERSHEGALLPEEYSVFNHIHERYEALSKVYHGK